MKKVSLIVALVILIDQVSKIYIKTNFHIGEEVDVIGEWFKLKFVENPGAAYGFQLGGYNGKILLSLLRMVLSGLIIWWVNKNINRGASNYFSIPMAMILAGAIGNLIDGALYGVLFDHGTVYYEQQGYWDWSVQGIPYVEQVSNLDYSGYNAPFFGCVVDMLYFPLFEFTWPEWIPGVGGTKTEFFRYIFNIADSSISIGVFFLLLFRKKAFLNVQ